MKISLTETMAWVIGELGDMFTGVVPDEAQLDIVIKRLKGKMVEARSAYHAALSDECEIQDPRHPGEGQLPLLVEQLGNYQSQGDRWSEEYHTATTKKPRKTRLRTLLEQLAVRCRVVEGEIASLRKNLAVRQETTQMRKDAFEKARRDLKILTETAPSILAQTAALEEATKARLEAAAATGRRAGNAGASGAVLAELEAALSEARADAASAEIIVDEADDGFFDIDDVIAEEAQESSVDTRINSWLAEPAKQPA